jgi:hypothetical protein
VEFVCVPTLFSVQCVLGFLFHVICMCSQCIYALIYDVYAVVCTLECVCSMLAIYVVYLDVYIGRYVVERTKSSLAVGVWRRVSACVV